MTDLLSSLNSEQQKAVLETRGPVLVLAGAGSGKTRTLTHRIAYLIQKGVEARKILAVTFTNKAAEVLRERLFFLLGTQNSEPSLGTFHAISARILREDGSAIGVKPNFTILDENDQRSVVKKTLEELGFSSADFNPRIFLNATDRIKRERVSSDQIVSMFSEIFSPPIDKMIEQVFLRYERRLLELNALDFGDLLLKTVLLFERHEPTRVKYQTRFEYILVDEYQDTNFVQYEWCRILSDLHKNLFVVGDDYQSIYSFRGADVQNILNFKSTYTDARQILLEENYRSTTPILNLANEVISKNTRQEKKRLWTSRIGGELPKIVEVENEREEALFVFNTILNAAPCFKNTSDTEYEYEYEDDRPLGRSILDRVMTARRGQRAVMSYEPPWADVSKINLNNFIVLYRTNAQSRAFEEQLVLHRIPYRIIGGVAFYERKEIKDILAYLKLLANHNDILALERIINVPPRGIGAKTYARFCRELDKFGADAFLASEAVLKGSVPECARIVPFSKTLLSLQSVCEELVPSECIDLCIEETGYNRYLKDTEENEEERRENLSQLKTVAERFSKEKGVSGLRVFLEEIALASPIDNYDGNNNALTLMTAHAAKGLEFSTVFMAGMEQGLFPHKSALIHREELEEERRLCYVGVTRAKDALYLIHARTRKLFGETRHAEVSEFLRDLGEDVAAKVVL